MAVVITKKLQSLSLSKLCRNYTLSGICRSSTGVTAAADVDNEQTSSSSSNESDSADHRRRVPKLRRLHEIATTKQTRTHADTIIRDRGIALLRNPHTNKVAFTVPVYPPVVDFSPPPPPPFCLALRPVFITLQKYVAKPLCSYRAF